MDPYHVCKQIIIKCIQIWHDEECNKRNVDKIADDELDAVIDDLYERKTASLKRKLRRGIKQLCDEPKEDDKIEEIINEIFEDETFCKCRIKTEIELKYLANQAL